MSNAGAIMAGEAYVSITGDMSQLISTMQATQTAFLQYVEGLSKKTETETKKIEKSFEQMANEMASKLNSAGSAIRNIGLAIGAAGAGIVGTLGLAVKDASDVEEMSSKFGSVFKELTDGATSWAADYAESVGRSKYQTMGFMATMQDTFVPLGFARDAAMDLSKGITTLAFDLASFNNQDPATAIMDLQSAMVGNHETMRKYGVIITEATLNTELMRMGIEGGTKAASEQEKVQARLNVIMGSTTDAQGDAAKTAGSFANRMVALKGYIQELTVTVGNVLLPVATKMVRWLAGAVQWLRDFAGEHPGVIKAVTVLGIALTAIGAVLSTFGMGMMAAGGIISGFTALAGVLGMTAGALATAIGTMMATLAPLAAIAVGIGAVIWAYMAWKDAVEQQAQAEADAQAMRDKSKETTYAAEEGDSAVTTKRKALMRQVQTIESRMADLKSDDPEYERLRGQADALRKRELELRNQEPATVEAAAAETSATATTEAKPFTETAEFKALPKALQAKVKAGLNAEAKATNPWEMEGWDQLPGEVQEMLLDQADAKAGKEQQKQADKAQSEYEKTARGDISMLKKYGFDEDAAKLERQMMSPYERFLADQSQRRDSGASLSDVTSALSMPSTEAVSAATTRPGDVRMVTGAFAESLRGGTNDGQRQLRAAEEGNKLLRTIAANTEKLRASYA